MIKKKLEKRIPWVIFSIFVLAGLVSRMWDLQTKPFHHDESLHAYYSLRVAGGSPHEYSALLHGPVLYYLVGSFMAAFKLLGFGITDFIARFPAALFGTLFIAAPIFLRRYVGWFAVLSLSFLFLVSPTLWYFSRFLREDVFVLSWMIAGLIAWFFVWQTRSTTASYLCSAFLALHFANKENSFLHLGIILIFLGAVYITDRTEWFSSKYDDTTSHIDSPISALSLWANISSIFLTIFTLFFSSFFRHSKGALHGILDGIYRESLLYWWNQNSIRRIDGPFDYHLPLIVNYEFLLLIPLILAWLRLIYLAHARRESDPGNFYLLAGKKASIIIGSASIFLLSFSFGAPRVAFVPEACEIAAFCVNDFGLFSNKVVKIAKLLHISNSYHLFQLLCYLFFGTLAFLNALFIRRKMDAFLWFWLTGALGIYSYVGEKVPWLLVYIVLPLLLIAGFEMGRIFARDDLPIDDGAAWFDRLPFLNEFSVSFSKKTFWLLLVVAVVCVPFTVYKGWRLCFPNAANPEERLVFTQTTPQVVKVRDRWRLAELTSNKRIKATMLGDATWPMAWYVHELNSAEFYKPDADKAKNFDLMFLDDKEIPALKASYPTFAIYRLQLRAWWVPGVNPTLTQLSDYFFTNKLYPVKNGGIETAVGTGSAAVLVLENTETGRPYSTLKVPDFMELVWKP